MILLTDGRVMVQEEATPHWHALTPDHHGSYINGTWSDLADMSFWRRYYASAVLRDGRVIVVGGEQSGDFGDTNKGEIYDPVSDTWTSIPTPLTWAQVGDASCCLLPDGRLMIGALLTSACAIYDPMSNTWSAGAAKAVKSNEETWVLLPDETILTIQCWPKYQPEKYGISSNAWKMEGTLPAVQIVDPVMSEIGPAMLLYDGKVIFFGADDFHGSGRTLIYTPPSSPAGTGTWVQGPDIPHVAQKPMVCNDCPASLMPNGKVLVTAANFVNGNWGLPIYFFEYDSYTNTIAQAPTPPNNNAQLYWSRLMLLPSGEVLFGPSSRNMQVYTPDGGPAEAWRPTITAVIPHGSGSVVDYYVLKGTQLNGLSQANMYGDDCYAATNYPLVRLRSLTTGEVHYARTFHFSTMGVATGSSIQAARFDPSGVPYGEYELCVVANGIASHCVNFCHGPADCSCETGTDRPNCSHGKCRCDDCSCGCGETRTDPVVGRVNKELRQLQRTVQRLASEAAREEPPREPKDSKGDPT